MITLTFQGTTHGKGYSGTINGIPSGFAISSSEIDRQLALRKGGIGRSNRQNIEQDHVKLSGLDNGISCGAIDFAIDNINHGVKDNITALRSGHIDVVVANTYGVDSVRTHNEVASARSSVGYVVAGSIAQQCLDTLGVSMFVHTLSIGGIHASVECNTASSDHLPLMCSDVLAVEQMTRAIELARAEGNSLGGRVRIVAHGVDMGLGYHSPYSARLDGIIAGALMSIPSVKAVSIGMGEHYADKTGRQVADKLKVENDNIVYDSNNCGGIVGGMSTGQDIIVELTVKPVPTVVGVDSIDSITHKATQAHYERADTCVVPNVGVIARNMLSTILLEQYIIKGKI